MVDASKINPKNCSFNELMVLNVETGNTSPSDYLRAVANTNPTNLKNRDWRGFALVAVSIILLMSSFFPLMLKMQLEMSMSTAVGVIGGADGPTSIFIAGKLGIPWGLYVATAVVIVVTIVYFVKKCRR